MRNRRKARGFWSQQLTGKRIFYAAASVIAIIVLAASSPIENLSRFLSHLEHVMSYFEIHPSSRSISDCFVILWSEDESGRHTEKILNLDYKDIAKTKFNRSNPVKILIHGFSDAANTLWTRTVRSSYLRKNKQINIFSVDWEKLAISPWYTTAAKNARIVGKYTTRFIHILVDEFNVSWSDIHVIGASLGGQAAGHVGFYTEGKLARITGLDPSGPLFHTSRPAFRLDPTDAQFVDIIHSAGRWVGSDDLMGHADFFPNLGKAPQPGCEGEESLDLSCSHFMSWEMFAKSINAKNPFYAMKCESEEEFVSGKCCLKHEMNSDTIVTMGEDVDRTARGRYYLVTDGDVAKPTKEESVKCEWVF